jgi:hypothetical protein
MRVPWFGNSPTLTPPGSLRFAAKHGLLVVDRPVNRPLQLLLLPAHPLLNPLAVVVIARLLLGMPVLPTLVASSYLTMAGSTRLGGGLRMKIQVSQLGNPLDPIICLCCCSQPLLLGSGPRSLVVKLPNVGGGWLKLVFMSLLQIS